MKEIEAKVLEINTSALDKAILRVGGKLVLRKTLFREWFFTLKSGRPKYSLRVRQEGKKTTLNIKLRVPNTKFKVSEETEVLVSNAALCRKILETMGYQVFRTREKYRTGYKLLGCKLEIDEYPGVPAYLEVEAQTEKALLVCLSKLGFKMEQVVSMSATEVLTKYGKGPNLVF